MNNYFTSFRQLTLLGVNNIRATIKIGYANVLGTNSCKKRNVATLNSTHQAKKGRAILTLFGTTTGHFT